MPLAPNVVANPRHDLLVASPDGQPLRHTIYSGRLMFGAPATRNTMMARMDFAGLLYLPDSLSYDPGQLGGSVLSADTWVGSVGREHLFVPNTEARFSNHPNNPGMLCVQLGVTVEGMTGAIVGYRVTVSTDPAAIQ